jgi:hypothetical protein
MDEVGDAGVHRLTMAAKRFERVKRTAYVRHLDRRSIELTAINFFQRQPELLGASRHVSALDHGLTLSKEERNFGPNACKP